LPSAEVVSVLPALQGVKGPVGGIRWVGVGDGVAVPFGVAEAVGVGLVVSDGLGVGAADAGLAKSANARDAAVANAAEILR
jgi:hypothetical protein